jgi:hypothetical protein
MNDVLRPQAIAFGHFRIAGFTASQKPALMEKLGAGSSMNGAIDSATAEQRGIGGIDDCLNF